MKNKVYLRWGVTVVLSACAILVFYDTFFLTGVLLDFFRALIRILAPVIYGFALAYLLAPVVNFFDRLFLRSIKRAGVVRALSIFVAWLMVLLVLYAFMNLLIPSLVSSVTLLVSNFENYYQKIYSWATVFVEHNPELSDYLLTAIRSYYKDLNSIVTTWQPQAQQAVLAVTGGLVSVLMFFKNLLIGIIVSVYLLATKEAFSCHGRKLLYSLVQEDRYALTLRGIGRMNFIFSSFVRGKLLDSLIIGILCLIFCWIFKFPYAPLISVFVGVTNVIPVFGPFIGAVPSSLLILLVDPIQCLYFVAFIIILQQFDGNILGPKILGSSTGLSSFWVIVAILVGGGFGGVLGMFLGVPIFACCYTFFNYLTSLRLAKKGVTDDAMFAPVTAQAQEPPKEAGE